MLHLLIIAAFLSVYLRDSLHRPLLSEYSSGRPEFWVPTATCSSLAAVWLMAHVFIWWNGRRIDRTGSWRAIRSAEAMLTASRIVAVLVHAFAILALGWLDVVRSWIGNPIALDELAACVPLLVVVVMGWWSIFPVDRRMREAVILSEFDRGRTVPPLVTRGQFVVGSLRHQVLWVVLPIACILAWGETTDLVQNRGWLPEGEAIKVGLQLAGLGVILTFMPLAMRRIWDTIALGAGPLRDRLLEMCRAQRVRVSELLVWRTHGVMINGAVMGLIPRLRYILLTDALLEHLPPTQVEAVTAHEIGHVKRRHILWLIASGMGTLMVTGVGVQLGMEMAVPGISATIAGQAIGMGISLGAAFVVFGLISRRFEWQADAFAVQHLSGLEPGRAGVVVTAEAVEAMKGALESVARLNHIPKRRFTWRHGSIATRLSRLDVLVGQRADRLAIDRQARWIAAVSTLLAVAAAGLIAYASVSSATTPATPARGPAWVGEGQERPAGMEVRGAIREDARDRERLHLS